MKKVLVIISILLSTFQILHSQDSLYTNFQFSPFENYDASVKAGGDLNGDGFDDLILTKNYGLEANIYFGGADFDTIPDLIILRENFDFRKVAYNGDLNGDGFDDLVLSNDSYPEPFANEWGIVWIFFGGSDFDLEPDIILEGQNYTNGHSSFEFRFGNQIDISADYNNDGYNDLTVFSEGYGGGMNGHLHVFNGSGEFDIIEDTFIEGEYLSYIGVFNSIGDINGDGFDDLAVTRQDPNVIPRDNYINVYPGTSEGLNDQMIISFEIPDEFNSYRVDLDISGDFNGDGYNDIVINRDAGDNTVVIGYGSNDYSFEDYQAWTFLGNISRIIIEDMNNDDFSDLIVPKVYEEIVEIYLGGNEGFSQNYSLFHSNIRVFAKYGKPKGSSYPSLLGWGREDDYSSYDYLTLLTMENLETGINENYYKSGIIKYELKQNYPNPFNPITKINYELDGTLVTNGLANYELAKIVVYNSTGQQIWQKELNKSLNSVLFDGSQFNSGIYHYSLIINNKIVDSKSMILIK